MNTETMEQVMIFFSGAAFGWCLACAWVNYLYVRLKIDAARG